MTVYDMRNSCEIPTSSDPSVNKGDAYPCFDESFILCHLLSEQQQQQEEERRSSLIAVSQGWEGETGGWTEDYRAAD